MPRQSTKSASTRRQFTDQETFDFSTPNLKVQARPVDAFASPGGPTGDARAVMAAFGNIKEGLGTYTKQKNEKDYQSGQMAQVKGETESPSKSAAWITGYESMRGEADVVGLNEALRKHYDTNWDTDPDAFAAGKEEIINTFLVDKSDAYLKSFVPGALRAEEQLTEKYQKARLAKTQEEIVTNARMSVRQQLDTLMSDPAAWANQAQTLRAHLTKIQEQSKQYGISRTEMALEMVEATGMRAVLEGKPELLDFATEPDKVGGVALADNPQLAAKVFSFRQQAENAAESNIKAADAHEKKQKENIKNYVERELVETLYNLDPNDRDGLNKAYTILHNASDPKRNEYGVAMDYKDIEHFYKIIHDLRGGGKGTFSVESDPDVYRETWTKASQGTLTDEDLHNAKGMLSRDHYMSIFKEKAESTSRRLSGKDSGFSPLWNQFRGSYTSILDQSNPYLGNMDQNGPKKVLEFDNLAQIKLSEFRAANDGKNPNSSEIYDIMKKAKEEVDAMHWPSMFEQATGKSTTSAPAQGQPAVAAPDPKQAALSRIEQIRARKGK